jgi:transposase
MRIIGCDLHARQQTLAMLDTATGEVVEVTLKHEGDNVREFYSALPRPVRVGIESTGSMQWLMTHPGVGPITALATEVFLGDPARFADSKALASYVGMIPREYSSGGRQRLGGLSKQGNPLLRFLWGEAGAHAARKDPELQRFYRRKLVQKGLGKASVAVARKLGIRLWIMLRDQIEYNEFCRRGQKQQKSSDACAGMPETRYGANSHRPVD